ncbi:Uncharacterized conserved protein, tellurite resistance protein B (TerB) family [Cognatiyoonia koreensis]|uniref:Uncharacterized conserved protein, tellurite resistance protein B (TerB) family n=1 Tax=Cognatiyoonia koreensis TaxID=364200 RepID=A0A1I0RJ83_9RHOB|nr:TerB family tellurite resistance protein [Cognatiyoonia koreensis]SEW41033.1 Uncharacterized conserved protein, tellurite resistance protein B (TerB) family [Cognatiyoonia koreensis]
MFENLLSYFKSPGSETPLPAADAKHALGALFVRAAKADKAYLFEEVEQIDRLLGAMYHLNPVEAAKMRASCERLEQAIPATTDLAGILREAISQTDREAAVSALWRVVFSDGVETEEEDAVLHQIEETLGVAPDVAKQLHDTEMAKMQR